MKRAVCLLVAVASFFCFSVSAFAADSVYTCTVNYIFEDGKTAAPVYIGKFAWGDALNIPSPFIAGYQPDKERVGGTMPDMDIFVTVTYSKVVPPPCAANHPGAPGLHLVTVNYSFPDGEAPPGFLPQQSPLTAPGALYSVTSPSVPGYTADTLIVSGVMGNSCFSASVAYHKDSGSSSSSGSSGSTPDPGPEPDPAPGLVIDPDYVGFNMDGLYEMGETLRVNMGTSFTVFLYAFLFVAGIYLIIKIADELIR